MQKKMKKNEKIGKKLEKNEQNMKKCKVSLS